MATEHHNNEAPFHDEHYTTLVGIIGTWRHIFREINEPPESMPLPSRELEDMTCAMQTLVDNLSAALGRRSIRAEAQYRKSLRQIDSAPADSPETDIAEILERIRSRQ